MTIRVLLADDHPVVRDGLRLTLERSGRDLVVVAEAADGAEVLELAGRLDIDVFVLDITMPNLNGIEVARTLRRRAPAAKLLMLSLHDTMILVEEAIEAGAHGYLTKETATRNVVDAILEVHAGRYYFSPAVSHLLVDRAFPGRRSQPAGRTTGTSLTPRERQVLQLAAEGHGNKEIAKILGVSAHTVHTHRNRVLAKLGLHGQSDLVRYALRQGLAKL